MIKLEDDENYNIHLVLLPGEVKYFALLNRFHVFENFNFLFFVLDHLSQN
jgi:hypothetical protein